MATRLSGIGSNLVILWFSQHLAAIYNKGAGYFDCKPRRNRQRSVDRHTSDYPCDDSRTCSFTAKMLASGTEGWNRNFRLCDRPRRLESPDYKYGHEPCLLPNHVSKITAIGTSGNRVTLSNGPLVGPAPPIILKPGIAKIYGILSAAFCDAVGLVQPFRHYSSVEMTLPAGILDLSKLVLRLCSDKVFSGFQQSGSAPPAPGTVASLNAKLEIPRTVKAGTTLDYRVVLENQSKETVDLNPCPVYKELIYVVNGAKGKTNSQVLQLNCSTVHSIKPHQKVTYQMVIQVPSETGLAKFSWQVEPSGPFAGGGVTIVE